MSPRDWNRALEQALEIFAQLVGEDAALEREFAASQAIFGRQDLSPAERLLADRRHLEWFVCERPSDRLEGVPVEALRAAWEELAEGPIAELADVLLCSVASAFEVIAIEHGETLLARDLFGIAEFEVSEPEASGELEVGDLLVGRLFPVTPELYRLSPATELFRDRALVDALHGDVDRMRSGRGRVLRMEQSELEALFFSPERRRKAPRTTAATGATAGDGPNAGEPPPADSKASRANAAGALIAAGLPADRAQETIEALVRLALEPRPRLGEVTEVLNELAFETAVDLGVARRTLLELWGDLRTKPPVTPPPAARAADENTAQALRHFDEGRARGEDLDALFRQLESELGVDGEDEADTEQSPDFPGVVGAMVEEYLWDRGRERERDDDDQSELLRELSRYGAGIGVFENLAPRDLLDFAGRWLLEESRLATEDEARALLDTLADFSRWCEERHAHALWSGFEELWQALYADVPRLIPLRSALTGTVEPDVDAYEVEDLRSEAVVLLRDDGHRIELPFAAEVRERLRPGDLLRLVTRPEGTLPCRVYPGVLRELLSSGERSA